MDDKLKVLELYLSLILIIFMAIKKPLYGMGRVPRTVYMEKTNELETLKTELVIVQKELSALSEQVRSLSATNNRLLKNFRADGGTLKQSIAQLAEEKIDLANRIKEISLELAEEKIKNENYTATLRKRYSE